MKEAWENQKQFVADASHELKTPLTIINGNFGILVDNRKETIESQMKCINSIKVGIDRMLKLINDMLNLATIERGDMNIQNEPFDLSGVIKEAADMMEPIMVQKGLRFTTSIEPDVIVQSDLEKVIQVIMILLDNAIKYTNDNGWIDVTFARSRRHAVCSIRNSGKGIPRQELTKIFNKFYRTDRSRAGDNVGYGLGLSIAKTLINKLNGEIAVASTENESTAFTFRLELLNK